MIISAFPSKVRGADTGCFPLLTGWTERCRALIGYQLPPHSLARCELSLQIFAEGSPSPSLSGLSFLTSLSRSLKTCFFPKSLPGTGLLGLVLGVKRGQRAKAMATEEAKACKGLVLSPERCLRRMSPGLHIRPSPLSSQQGLFWWKSQHVLSSPGGGVTGPSSAKSISFTAPPWGFSWLL